MLRRQWRELAGGTAVAAALLLGAAAPAVAQQPRQQPPPQQGQQRPPPQNQQPPAQQGGERVQVVDINQVLVDRWLVLFADLTPKLANSDKLSEQQVDAIVAQACQRAQLADVNQCRALDAYMGALLSGADDQSKRFVDPVQRLRQDLQASQTDQKLNPQEKKEAKAELEGLLASMPERVPPQHIQLLNQNAQKIFAVLAKVQPPEQGQQQGAPQGQPGGQRGAPPPAQGGGQQPRR